MSVKTTYSVTGMTCDHCVRAVTEELGQVEGVTAVSVDLARGEVTVDSTTVLDQSTVADAVDEAGYSLA